jgi:hypothetical protein
MRLIMVPTFCQRKYLLQILKKDQSNHEVNHGPNMSWVYVHTHYKTEMHEQKNQLKQNLYT